MTNQKKLQIFISSTYLDLIEERQAAVEAILKAGHIPAGMELFTASNKSQWDIITRWIDESDIYMLILGGRYGSIENESQKSYTHLEYEYAQSQGKPLFAVVIEDSALDSRKSRDIEKDNPERLNEFRKKVLSYMSSFFTDKKDIKLAVHENMGQITQDYNLTGWIRGNQQNSDIAKEMVTLNEELRKVKEENKKLKLEQIKRLPEIVVSINGNHNLEFKLEIDQRNFYKKREPIENIPKHLADHICQQEINAYNESLANIVESDIVCFNEIQTKINSLITSQKKFEINLSNIGNIKANNIHINIIFPDLVIVTDNQNEISKAIDKLNDDLKRTIPTNNSDPIFEAEKNFKENIKVGSVEHTMNMINRISSISSYSSHDYHNLSLPKNFDKDNYDSVRNNRITIVTPQLMHSIKSNYKNYFLVPLKKGTGVIRIEVICEEYLQPATYEIPITVS